MAGDADYASVSLLLKADGANGSTSFADLSRNALAITALGTAAISTAQSKFGGSSVGLDGSASCRLSVASSSVLEAGSGDFTIEMFARPTATPGTAGFMIYRPNASGYPNFSISFRSTGKIEAYFSRNTPATAPTVLNSSASLTLNTWTHIALVKSGTSVKLFIGGVLDTSVTIADHPPTGLSTLTYIGSDATYAFTGHLDSIRVTKGVARYTATFTPPSVDFIGGLGQVSGVVRDDTNTPCARTVRVYRRDTGALAGLSTVSDAGTGSYTIDCYTLDEVQRIVLDDSGGTLYNDLIDRVIPA